MKIYIEHFAKGCYYFYDDYLKIGYTIYGVNERTAKRKLRERYNLGRVKIEYINK